MHGLGPNRLSLGYQSILVVAVSMLDMSLECVTSAPEYPERCGVASVSSPWLPTLSSVPADRVWSVTSPNLPRLVDDRSLQFNTYIAQPSIFKL